MRNPAKIEKKKEQKGRKEKKKKNMRYEMMASWIMCGVALHGMM